MERQLWNTMTLFTAITVDYQADITSRQESLLDLCLNSMISDVYMLHQTLGRIPGLIQNKLMDKALAKNRVLSVKFLLKTCQYEEFILPLPDSLKNWSVLHKDTTIIMNAMRTIHSNANIVISAFMDIMSQKSKSSNLRIVDLNEFPQDNSTLQLFCCFANSNAKLLDTEYILKGVFTFSEKADFINLCRAKSNNPKYLKIIVTGIQLLYGKFEEEHIMDLMNQMDCTELLYFSMECLRHIGSSRLLVKMRKFTNLTAFNLTYILNCTRERNEKLLNAIAETLYELPHLTRLSLRGNKLTNCLSTVFLKGCRIENLKLKKQKTDSGLNCCIAHRGKLRYLDLSSCELVDEDLECLKEYPLTESVRYLNLGCNTFQAIKLAEYVGLMGSSLVMIDVEQSIMKSSPVEPYLEGMYKMVALKSLYMKSIKVEYHHLPVLRNILWNMPKLKNVYISVPANTTSKEQEILTHSLKCEKGIDITWF